MDERRAGDVHAQDVGEEGRKQPFLKAKHQDGKIRVLVRPEERLMPVNEQEEAVVEEMFGDFGSQEQRLGGDEPNDTEGDECNAEGEKEGLSQGRREKEESERGEGEEGRRSRGIRAPQRISKQEKEEHERTHTPFRAWCSHCVRGRGKNTPHRKNKDTEDIAVPRVSMDYFFMSDEDQKASENPIFAMVDEETTEKYARAVGQKGLGVDRGIDWLIKDNSEELKAWGHSGGDGVSLILKCDGEASIWALREAVAKFHGGRIIPEGPAKGESQSNGVIE